MNLIDTLTPYAPTVTALGAIGGLLLLQILIADLAGIKAGHRPGHPVQPDHGNFLFRATRAQANTNENLGAFIVLVLFGLLSGAAAGWLNGLAWLYVAARLGHMLCYYANLGIARSVAFGIGLVAQFGLLIAGVAAWAGSPAGG